MKKKYFGTDGIRARSNSEKLNGLTLMKLGMALGQYFKTGDHRHRVVIGKDTRLSGYMIEQAVTSGLLSMGMDVFLFGPIPTPAVAMLTKSMRADLGIMITASHNKFEDNGLKIFDKDGNKLSDETELKIEELMNSSLEKSLINSESIGRAKRLEDANARYVEFLKNTFPKSQRLDGLKIVMDCANGASYISAPLILWELGAEVIEIGNSPDGFNINENCGSTDTRLLSERVIEEKADIGIALDGDGDRIIISDENGHIVDGDQILGLLSLDLKNRGQLLQNKVVGTSMTNKGLEKKFNDHGIELVRTDVGDRYVKERMIQENINIGGEQSGHIIMRDFTNTGDGMVVALQILSVLKSNKKNVSDLMKFFEPIPQKLINVKVDSRDILENEKTNNFFSQIEEKVADQGRIIVRMSGTEPLLRVMVECETEKRLNEISDQVEKYFS
tara:strand:+ start:1017 stop:2351 length:1335 start_codon:yes stop_codon:yes gene_type:complete